MAVVGLRAKLGRNLRNHFARFALARFGCWRRLRLRRRRGTATKTAKHHRLRRPLLQWEAGDDLSVVTALCRAFRPVLPNAEDNLNHINNPCRCRCLLCCENSNDDNGNGNHNDKTKDQERLLQEAKQTNNKNSNNKNSSSNSNNNSNIVTSEVGCNNNGNGSDDGGGVNDKHGSDRSLHLYCRLFYRQGPWFRLDDIYFRYYAPPALPTNATAATTTTTTTTTKTTKPKPFLASLNQQQEKEATNDDGSSTGAIIVPNSNGPDATATSARKTSLLPLSRKLSFFQRGKKRTTTKKRKWDAQQPTPRPGSFSNCQQQDHQQHTCCNSTSTGKQHDWLDPEELSRHLDALTQLVHDVHSLRAKGWIRGFFDEEECGRSVGSSKGQLGGSSPLTAAEQRVVLTKLGGGGGGGAKCQIKRSRSQGRGQKRRHSDSRHGVTNAIWKQMSQQRSIVSVAAAIAAGANHPSIKDKNTPSLLPVLRHVDGVIFERLAKRIALWCRRGAPHDNSNNHRRYDHVPVQVLRLCRTSIDQTLRRATSSLKIHTNTIGTLAAVAAANQLMPGV